RLVPLVAAAEYFLGEVEREVVIEIVGIDVDRLVGPLARQSELAPGPDILFRPAGDARVPVVPLPAAVSLGTEDPVELFHRQVADWIVTVDERHQRKRPARDVV